MDVNSDLSKPDERGLARHLECAEVLEQTVQQLRKDLALSDAELPGPVVGEGAFEELRAAVHPVLLRLDRMGGQALQASMYRVDIPEAHLHRTLNAGGLHALAGECVLRALQKVLTRLRFAGRF